VEERKKLAGRLQSGMSGHATCQSGVHSPIHACKSGESRSRTTEVLDSAASLCVYTQESKNRVPGVLRGRVGGTLEKSS
jgi:hypothetical protein